MSIRSLLIEALRRPWRERAERAAQAESEARALIADKGRIGALFAIDALRNEAHRNPAARRTADALQQAVNRLSPRLPRADVATRMHYWDGR